MEQSILDMELELHLKLLLNSQQVQKLSMMLIADTVDMSGLDNLDQMDTDT